MQFALVNPTAIILAAIVTNILAYVWYVPLFGAQWRALTSRTEADMRRPQVIALLALGILVTAFTLGEFVSYAGAATLAGGALVGLLAWFGFYAATTFTNVISQGRAAKLYFIDNGFSLVSFAVMGAILGAFR